MFFPKLVLTALAGSALVNAAPVLNARKDAPTGWAHSVLEDYNTYHVRYIALSCYTQHNTTFFDDCCRPLRANATLEDRPQECTPNATALESASARVSAAAAKATATATISGADVPTASVVAEDDTASQYVSQAAADATSSTIEGNNFAAAASPTSTTESTAPAPTSTAEPTTTSTTEEPTTTSTTEEAPAPTTSKSSQPQATADSGSPSGTSYEGWATFYSQNDGTPLSGTAATDDSNTYPGSCGWKSKDTDFVAAISTSGHSEWANSLCGQYVTVTNIDTNPWSKKGPQTSVRVKIVDQCPTCSSANSIDLSPAAFNQIADPSAGQIKVSWQFS